MMLKYLIGFLLLFPVLGHADEARSVNFAVFQSVDKDFEFEATVEGKFSDFIAEMEIVEIGRNRGQYTL